MEFKFEAKVLMTVETDQPGINAATKHCNTSIILNVSDNLDQSAYYDEDMNLTTSGVNCMRKTLVSGLSCLIHMAHQKGLIDSAVQLREAIRQLEEEFTQPVSIINSDYPEINP